MCTPGSFGVSTLVTELLQKKNVLHLHIIEYDLLLFGAW